MRHAVISTFMALAACQRCPDYRDRLTNIGVCSDGFNGVCPGEGSNSSAVSIAISGGVRTVVTSGCPPQEMWTCLQSPTATPACEKATTWRMPSNPQFATSPLPLGLGASRGINIVKVPVSQNVFQGPIGVLVNGVPIYSVGIRASLYAGPDEWQDAREAAADFEDFCGGLTDSDGVYHIHRLPRRVVWAQRPGDRSSCALPSDDQTVGRHSDLLGWALDGFEIYGPRNPKGEPTRDLDECGGQVGHAPGQGPIAYHYHITDEYPFTLECLQGCPVSNSGNPALDTYASTCTSAPHRMLAGADKARSEL